MKQVTITPTKSVTSKKPVTVSAPLPSPKTVFAAQMSGYDASSPIWKKQLPEVLDMIDAGVDASDGPTIKAITQELRKRIVKGKLIKAQR